MKYTTIVSILLTTCILFGCFQKEKQISDNQSLVRVSAKNPLYLELSNGNPYIPVGPNICFPRLITDETEAFENLEWMYQKLAENKANYSRIYLGAAFYDIEKYKQGEYDEHQIQKIDKILELASKYGIRIKFCFEHFRNLIGNDAVFATSAHFDKPIYHVSHGGTFTSAKEFFASEEGKQVYLNRVRFFTERYKDHPNVYGWELWNEFDVVDMDGKPQSTVEWTEDMLARVKSLAPNHLVMQNLGSFDSERHRELYRSVCSLKGNDVLQVHRYIDEAARLPICQAPMDVLTSDAIKELLAFGLNRPVLITETGAVEPRHAGPFRYYEKDKDGTILHDLLFAPFFSGSAGAGQSWHWHYYIELNNLWHHFGRFNEAISGINPLEENFVPMQIEHDLLRIYVLKGDKNTLMWCRDANNDWKSELVEGIEPALLSNVTINAHTITNKSGNADLYDPWKNTWEKTSFADGEIVIPSMKRSIVIRIKNE